MARRPKFLPDRLRWRNLASRPLFATGCKKNVGAEPQRPPLLRSDHVGRGSIYRPARPGGQIGRVVARDVQAASGSIGCRRSATLLGSGSQYPAELRR